MSKSKPLPPAEHLRRCIAYDPASGIAIWRRRPREHFRSAQAAAVWNGKFSGRPIGGHLPWLVCIDNRRMSAPRVIWKIMTGSDPTGEIDHINCDPGDQRWANLRIATHAENGRNRGAIARRQGMLKGAYPYRDRWTSIVTINGKSQRLGTFATAEEAHAAYCEAMQPHHREFFRAV